MAGGNNNGWKVMAGGAVGLLAVTFTTMGIMFRVHAAQPHDKSVSETEFKVFLEQDLEVRREIKNELKEVRACLMRWLEAQALTPADPGSTTP
jgi:hypothetical protein